MDACPRNATAPSPEQRSPAMILKQFYLDCLAHASYLVVDERTKTAAVIDPQRDIDAYVKEAERLGVSIEYVFLTHFHADFIAGHLELRDRFGASIYLGAAAQAEYAFRPLKDGDAVQFGDVQLRILETPGHTPEGISILAFDLAKSDEVPEAVFTGDTLFVGDVGRPDLLASVGVTADELANMLYDSLHGKLMALPDATIVYPAHGAGSLCGKNLGKETFSTIGEQRLFNYALQPMDKDAFRAIVTAEQPEAPPYFLYDATMNKQERATLEESLVRAMKGLSLREVLELKDQGAQIVDVRDSADFAGAHLAGSINIGLGGRYATWAGTLLSREQPIVIVADPGQQHEAAVRLGRIGLDRVAGFLQGGMGAAETSPDLVRPSERTTARALVISLEEQDAPLVVDVRTEQEWKTGHVIGSVNIPLSEIPHRLDEIPLDREVAVICRSGYRSSMATSLLESAGYSRTMDCVGGMDAWRASALPTSEPEGASCQA